MYNTYLSKKINQFPVPHKYTPTKPIIRSITPKDITKKFGNLTVEKKINYKTYTKTPWDIPELQKNSVDLMLAKTMEKDGS